MAARLRLGVLVLLLVTAVVAAGWSVARYWQLQQVDAGLDRVARAATGEFKAEYERDRAALREAYTANALSARGEVLAAGVVTADRDSATVLLAVEQTVTRKGAEQPQQRHYRIRLQ